MGPAGCASKSFVIVRLAAADNAPPPSAVPRKLRRDNFCLFMLLSLEAGRGTKEPVPVSFGLCPVARGRNAASLWDRPFSVADGLSFGGYPDVAMHNIGLRPQILRRAIVGDVAFFHQ